MKENSFHEPFLHSEYNGGVHWRCLSAGDTQLHDCSGLFFFHYTFWAAVPCRKSFEGLTAGGFGFGVGGGGGNRSPNSSKGALHPDEQGQASDLVRSGEAGIIAPLQTPPSSSLSGPNLRPRGPTRALTHAKSTLTFNIHALTKTEAGKEKTKKQQK